MCYFYSKVYGCRVIATSVLGNWCLNKTDHLFCWILKRFLGLLSLNSKWSTLLSPSVALQYFLCTNMVLVVNPSLSTTTASELQEDLNSIPMTIWHIIIWNQQKENVAAPFQQRIHKMVSSSPPMFSFGLHSSEKDTTTVCLWWNISIHTVGCIVRSIIIFLLQPVLPLY